MKLELKKISFSEALSDETNAFTADVYIDGVKRATASNHGQGGPTSVDAYAKLRKSPEGDQAYFAERKGNQVFIDQYEAWAKTQPDVESEVPGWGKFNLPRSLEADVDLLLEQWLKAEYAKKDAARLKRMCQKNWVFSLHEQDGQPLDANTIFTIPRKPAQTLAGVKTHLTGKYGKNLKQLLNETYG